MKLCLGPTMVAILRNARSVLGVEVSTDWVDPKGGACNMSRSHDAQDVKSVGEALGKIASSEHVAEFRRMPDAQFKSIFESAKASWKKLANNMRSSNNEFQYAERNPSKEPSSNVVLGSPNHKDMGLEYAYENTPISMRQTEPTAAFYLDSDPALIRPSQFITKYGPGAIVSGKSTAWVVPNMNCMVASLRGKGNFDVTNNKARKRLYKYEVDDHRMERVLRRLHPKSCTEEIKLFTLPSNSSLTIGNSEDLYECVPLSHWAICYNSAHPSKILAKTQRRGRRVIFECPECERASGAKESTKFYGVRYVMACKRGHLGDVDWRREVHRNGKPCKGNVFELRASGGNDNVEISCMECGGAVTHKQLKALSKSGQMACSARFAEGGDDQRGCESDDGKSMAKMVSKTQMSLRMPIVATTMEIPEYGGTLAEYYGNYKLAKDIDTYMVAVAEEFSKDDFVKFLKRQKDSNKPGYTDTLIRLTEGATDRDVIDAICVARKTSSGGGQERGQLSEIESLNDELSSLERQTRDRGTGTRIGPDAPPPDRRFPIQFSAAGSRFEAMPFENINVTQVQTGYTREIHPPAEQRPSEVESETLRIGYPVRHSATFKEGKSIWYVANRLVGEGIFIHLDPDRHMDGADVLGKDEHAKAWWNVHRFVRQRNDLRCKRLKGAEGKEEEIDALQAEAVLTNPVFGWWHSFAHELINQLATDSGFTGASLGERVYCKARNDGGYDAGVLIYATSPGADGTLGGLTSLVDKDALPKIVEKTLRNARGCSNDPICSGRRRSYRSAIGAACHACLMNPETSCSYHNKFLDRNLVAGALHY